MAAAAGKILSIGELRRPRHYMAIYPNRSQKLIQYMGMSGQLHKFFLHDYDENTVVIVYYTPAHAARLKFFEVHQSAGRRRRSRKTRRRSRN